MTTPSGPGQFSQRTDKAVSGANTSLPNAMYGEAKEYEEQRTGADMAKSPSGGGPPVDIGSLMGAMRPEAVGLGEESSMPDTPVTDGAALGPGAGPEVLTSSQPTSSTAYLAAYLPALEWMADQPNSSDSARNLVRQMKSQT